MAETHIEQFDWQFNGKVTFAGGTAIELGDDDLLTFGDDNDVALALRSTSLSANTAVSGLIVGTPITPAVAANSFIVGNVTADGDILLAGQTGGNSHAVFFADLSAGTTSIMVAGVAVARFDATDVLFPDDYILTVGTGTSIAYKDDSTLANTAVTNVILGTPVTPALAADTLIVANQISNGDLLLATQTGGNTQAAIWVDGSAGLTQVFGAGTLGLSVSATAVNCALNAVPSASDGSALGTTALMWADLFLASGGVINFNNGNVTITHAAASLTVAGATAISIGANTLNVTGTRVLQSYHTNITSTNAVTVDSSIQSKVPESIHDYDKSATAILKGVRVIDYQHLDTIDPSGRTKLGIVAETLEEPLALTEILDPRRDGETYPGVNLMGLVALLVKQAQEHTAEIEALKRRH